MRLNPTGGAAALGFSTNISINGTVPAALAGVGAQLPRWIDGAGNVIFYVNVDDNELQTLDLDAGVPVTVSAGTATTCAAGNSLWVAASSIGALVGVRSNISGWVRQPAGGNVDMDETGRFAFVQAFAQDRGIVFYDASGVLVYTLDAAVSPAGVIRCKTGLCAFALGGLAWQVRDLTDGSVVNFTPRVTGVIETVPIVLADATIWVLERTGDDTLTFRGAAQGQGYVISSSITFNPDVIELTPGVVRIGWSATSGEGPTALRMVDLTLGSGTNTQWTSASGSLVSSAGTPISGLTAMATSGGSNGRELQALLNHPFTKPNHVITPEWQKIINKLFFNNAQPIDLSSGQVTGVLPPDHGGTGGGSGTSIINASNVTIGNLPQNVKWQQYNTSATGAQDNFVFSIGSTQADCIRCENATTLTLSGLVAGVPAQRLVVIASDADVVFLHESGLSTDVNRIETFSNLDVTVTVDQAAYFSYDGTSDRWRLLLVSAASVDVESAGYWSPLCAGPTINLATAVPATGYWSPLMTGPDPATSELVLDAAGDTYALWQQLNPGPYLPPLVDSQADTISVFTPTP